MVLDIHNSMYVNGKISYIVYDNDEIFFIGNNIITAGLNSHMRAYEIKVVNKSYFFCSIKSLHFAKPLSYHQTSSGAFYINSFLNKRPNVATFDGVLRFQYMKAFEQYI